jgi:hypothetical protein
MAMPLSTMNWRRGLLRLWAVAAVLWFVLSVFKILKLNNFRLLDFNEFYTLLIILSIPLLLLLALGYIGIWIGRGFRK